MHFVYIRDDHPAQFLPFFAMYAGGYLFWGAIARAAGAASVYAITFPLFLMGMFFSVSAAIGWLIVPTVALPSLAGLLAAVAWSSRRREADWSVPPPSRTPATTVDFVVVLLPAALVAAAVIAIVRSGGVEGTALQPWAIVLAYLGFVGGFGLCRLQPRDNVRRMLLPAALIAALGVALGSTLYLGVVVFLFVTPPAVGAVVATLLAELAPDNGSPAPSR